MGENFLTKEEWLFDLTKELPLPRLQRLDTGVLPDTWPEFCEKNKLRITAVLMYENEIENQKLWAAAGVVSAGIRRGAHIGKKKLGDSTSGNYGEALAAVLEMVRARLPDFPVESVFAVTPKLPEGKKARLVARGIELIPAEDSLHAMKVAKALGSSPEVWYTEQYWNRDNSNSYHLVGEHIARELPHIGAIACGIGSGGSFSGVVETLEDSLARHRKLLHRIAVAVQPGSKVPGVRDPVALMPGTLPWRRFADDVRYFGSEDALKMSSALWKQPGLIAGPSSGFALIGGLLSLHVLWLLQRLDQLRGPDDWVDLAVLFPDTRKPYRQEYLEAGYELPDEAEWDRRIVA